MDKVRNVLGEIDLDPASSHQANEVVKAKKYMTRGALVQDWLTEPGKIYLNPPGGKISGKSQAKLFWQKLMTYRDNGLLLEAIFLAFNLEAMQNTQIGCERSICDFTICIPSQRIAFIDPITGVGAKPSHGNAIVYVPGIDDNTHLFRREFYNVGAMVRPY